MQKFYHKQIQDVKLLLQQLNVAMDQYSHKLYHADETLMTVLNTAIKTYKDLGKSERESQLQALKTELVTATRGINPLTFEKQTTRRAELISIIAFKVMQATETMFRLDVENDQSKLTQANELITQILIASIQSGKLPDADIKKIKTIADAEKAWKKIGADANISLGQKRVLLLISQVDAMILFDDLLMPFKK